MIRRGGVPSRLGEAPAINNELGSRDVTRLVRQQERHGVRDVLDLPDPSEGHVIVDRVNRLVVVLPARLHR